MQDISLVRKIVTCFISGLIASFAVQRITYRTIWDFGNKWVPPPVFATSFILLVLFAAIIYAFYWHNKEGKEQKSFPQILGFWQGVIRFFISLDLSMIGWQKIFHLQFFTPLGRLDQPFSSFSGESLSWAYFGYSFAFACLIGLLQIAGSYLLLFKRTSLLGCFILFPILLNIICIDLFYHFETGELAHAIILMSGVLYLLLQEYSKLMAFFFSKMNNFSVVHFKTHLTPALIRLSAILIPLLLIFSFDSSDKNPQLTGKYAVTHLLVNQNPVITTSCQDSVLTTVYLDRGNEVVFEFNSQQRRLIGSYQFGKQNNRFNAVWNFPSGKPSFSGTLIEKSQNQFALTGTIGVDSLEMILLHQPVCVMKN